MSLPSTYKFKAYLWDPVYRACILAILFMDKLENKALFSCLYIDPYKRYVDDIYAQTTDESNLTPFTII